MSSDSAVLQLIFLISDWHMYSLNPVYLLFWALSLKAVDLWRSVASASEAVSPVISSPLKPRSSVPIQISVAVAIPAMWFSVPVTVRAYKC